MKRLATLLMVLALGAGLAIANPQTADKPTDSKASPDRECGAATGAPAPSSATTPDLPARSPAELADLAERHGGSISASITLDVPQCPDTYSCHSRCRGQACSPGACTQSDIGGSCRISDQSVFMCPPGKTIHVTTCGVCEQEIVGCGVCDHIGAQSWSCQ